MIYALLRTGDCHGELMLYPCMLPLCTASMRLNRHGTQLHAQLIHLVDVDDPSTRGLPPHSRLQPAHQHDTTITVDGEVVTDPDMTLGDGSKLVYHRFPWQEPFAPYLLEVLYEDDDMVALNKPSGLQVLPKGLFQQRTVLAQLQLKDWKMASSCRFKRKDVQSHPVPVHRLGRGTSGLLLCAKTKVAKVRLASYFAEGAINAAKKRDKSEFSEERKISKFYRALVTGILDDDEVVVTQPIGLVHYPGVAEGLYAACSSGKPAMSKVCVLERLAHQNHTLVQVEIHSGRPHQIRIHLAYIGHPLVGKSLAHST
ncbi:RNA pseudouridine synthase 5 [Zea mays]|uniref:RNA pseudouridine synthase 5 n=1 Tax=Zea mays TaxID=4577 RepID=A0A317YCX1_MAIZE|nr:RNA pseudouridine synthase 5 [Zea mays]